MDSKGLVVITGASSGIGQSVARLFSKNGYPLLLLARRVEKMKDMNLPGCICREMDVWDGDAFVSHVAEAERRYRPVDCLINNAGLMLLGDPSEQHLSEWKEMIDINIMGLLNGIHSVLPGMCDRKVGTIVNIGSVAGRKTLYNHAVYCGTKHAVHAISENMRMEMAKYNVRFITIAPGATSTELIHHTTNKGIREGYTSWAESIGGAISPDDVARSVFFAFSQPQGICIREIVLAPTLQEP